jgi:hypothetical protein
MRLGRLERGAEGMHFLHAIRALTASASPRIRRRGDPKKPPHRFTPGSLPSGFGRAWPGSR